MNVDQLQRDVEAKIASGLALLKSTATTAQTENRNMTDEEIAAIRAVGQEASTLRTRVALAQGDDALMRELERLTGGVGGFKAASPAAARQMLSLGEQWVRSEGYAFIKAGGHRSQSAWRSPGVELEPYWSLPSWVAPKAATLTSDPASGGALIIPQYLPGILPLPTRQLVVADLMATGTTDSNQISYMREKTFTNAAAPVLEGGLKPESTLIFESTTDPVRKLAHWLPATEEMLEDAPQIRSYIDSRLRLGIQLKEEDQLLNGTGVAPELLGLLLRPGLGADEIRTDTAPVETNADAILKQMMALYQSSLLPPDGIVMNPLNWTSTLLVKTTTGEYLTPGPFAPVQVPTLWGLPVAVTPATAAGVAVVGAFQTASQVFRKGGIRVEASNSHADFFIKNLVAIRAEERLALAVYRPGAFGKVTGLN